MAYQNIPAASGIDVVKQIANFATSNGWTVNKNEQYSYESEFWYVVLSYSATGPFFSLLGRNDGIYMNLHREYTGSAEWDDQPDQSMDTKDSNRFAYIGLRTLPTVGVHLFGAMTPTPYIFVAIEKQPGYYRHLTIGQLDTFGAVDGGAFMDIGGPDLSRSSVHSYIKLPLVYNTSGYTRQYKGSIDVRPDATTKIWAHFRVDQIQAGAYQAGHSAMELYNILQRSPSVYNSRTILQPPFVNVYGYEGATVPLGSHAAIRYLNMQYYNAGDEITIGSDIWKIFPVVRKGGANNLNLNDAADEGSGNIGIAYLKV